MDQVDIPRMQRVLSRVYPPDPTPDRRPPPPGGRGDEACRLLAAERQLNALLQRLMRASGECRRNLQGVLRRCAGRERRLRTECFIAGGPGAPGPEPRRGREGVLSSLRRAERLLRDLTEDYRDAADREPERRELYRRFSRECRQDAAAVENLLERALG